MKKLLFFAFAICICAASCKTETTKVENNDATETADSTVSTDSTVKADSTAAATPEASAPEASASASSSASSMADVLAKVKAEGSKWSEDEWKSAYKDFALAYKPFALKMVDVLKKMQEPGKAEEGMKELKSLDAEYKEINKMLDDFINAAQATAAGKAMVDNQEWLTKTNDELGIPEL